MRQVRIIKYSQKTMLVRDMTSRALKFISSDQLLKAVDDKSMEVVNIIMLENYLDDLKKLSILKQILEN